MISSLTSPDRLSRHSPWRPLAAALAFATAGTLFGAHRLATVILRHILVPDPSLAYQEVNDYLPVPRRLDWNLTLIQTGVWLRETRGLVLAGAGTLVLILLGWIFLALVLGGRRARKSRLFPSTGAAPGEQIEPPEDVVDLPAAPPRRSFPWLLPAGVYGIGVALLVMFGVPPLSEGLLRYYHTLGTFHQDYFQRLAVPLLASIAAIWAGGGLLLFASCAPRRGFRARLALAGIATALFGIAWWAQRPLQVKTLARDRDWTPAVLTAASPYSPDSPASGVPDGVYAGEELASRLQLKLGNQPEQPERPLLVFYSDGVLNVRQEGYTEDGLTASEQSAKAVRAFLERRHFESALSWVAIKHLYNVATIHFDETAALNACMLDMEECPHLSQCGMTTRGMLFTCAATPDNLAVLDRWADERWFAHPTRESQRLMGELYERFGAVEKALAWYRRADMPRSFLAKVQGERALFHTGKVTGRLVLNGKPLAGVQVGMVPRRLNGLPTDLEPAVLGARADLTAFRPQAMLFPRFCPRPFSFRWISGAAVTDGDGRFSVADLTEGEYVFVCMLPPQVKLRPPRDPSLTISNKLPRILLNYDSLSCDLGTISIAMRK